MSHNHVCYRCRNPAVYLCKCRSPPYYLCGFDLSNHIIGKGSHEFSELEDLVERRFFLRVQNGFVRLRKFIVKKIIKSNKAINRDAKRSILAITRQDLKSRKEFLMNVARKKKILSTETKKSQVFLFTLIAESKVIYKNKQIRPFAASARLLELLKSQPLIDKPMLKDIGYSDQDADMDRSYDPLVLFDIQEVADQQGVYSGSMINGKKEGKGTYKYSNGAEYNGYWKNNLRDGKGTFKYTDGAYYEGEWKEGKPHGKGGHKFADGSIYQGDWKAGNMEGTGKYLGTDGAVYDGEWRNGMKHGNGQETLSKDVYLLGMWNNNQKEGGFTRVQGLSTNSEFYISDYKVA